MSRVIKINVGDHWTTNTLGKGNTDGKAVVECGDFSVGDLVKVDATGFIVPGEDANFQLQVVKVYTLADGQPAVKVMRIK